MEYKDSKLLQAALDFQNNQADPDINDIKDFFIAGAEWMARQGVNIHGRVLPGTHGNSYVESDYFDKGYGGLSWNDEVDLIIRKKQ